MSRILGFAYGTFSYLCFLAVFLYAIGFAGNVLVPRSIDIGPAGPAAEAVLINVLLLSLFAVQHSGMARRSFKAFWMKLVPPAIERSTYVLFSSAVLALLFAEWRPIPDIVWNIESPAGRMAVYALFATGWIIVLLATFMISHFDLFGMRQVWMNLQQRQYGELRFRTVGFYKLVRHPLQTGFLIAFWATPTMTAGHLLFSVVVTAYIVIAVKFFEERDLVRMFGNTYRRYQQQVSMFFPFPKPAAAAPRVSTDSAVGN